MCMPYILILLQYGRFGNVIVNFLIPLLFDNIY